MEREVKARRIAFTGPGLDFARAPGREIAYDRIPVALEGLDYRLVLLTPG